MKLDIEFVWRFLPAVRRRERQRFVFFAGLFAIINLAQIVGLVGSEALFLARLGSAQLPAVFVLASLASVAGCLLYAAAVGRMRNDRLYAWMFAVAALALGLATALLPVAGSWILPGLFCAFYVTEAVFVNLHFWTFATDYFDTLSSKRLFPLFAAGGSVGGALGGLLALALSRWSATESLIVAWALALLAAAGLVLSARRGLRRWLPVGTVEADESSVAGMRGALEFARRSPLARGLVLSVVGMVFALFLIQFLYLEIFSSKFQSAEELAGFFGIYLALANGIEIVVLNVVTPMLIRRFGVAQANLVHPLLMLLSFGTLALDPALYTAIFARASRELLENALAFPVRALSYNALPLRFRNRIRASLDGIVFYAAMSLAGLALLAVGEQVSFGWVCILGMAAAGLYALANLRVRREYVRSLVNELRSGRLDIPEVGGELAEHELENLATQWEELLREEGEHASQAMLQLIPLLVRGGFPEAVRKAASHRNPRVRISSLDALAAASDEALAELLPSSLVDGDPQVRLAAARAAGRIEVRTEALGRGLRRGLSDSDSRVRAESALQLAEEGLPSLRAMAVGRHPQAAIEALRRLPRGLLAEARSRLADAHAGVRAAALACVVRLSDRHSLTPAWLEAKLHDPDAGVRREAIRALRSHGGPESAAALAAALDDVSRAVRVEASRSLAALGETGVRAAESALRSARTWTVDAGLSVLAIEGGTLARTLLLRAFGDQVRAAWRSRAAQAWVASDGALHHRFLSTALEDAFARSCRLAFRSLQLLEDPAVVRSVRQSLDLDSPRARADALEVLSNLGERHSAELLSLLLEDSPFDDKLPLVAQSVALPTNFDEVLREAATSRDRWQLLAAAGATQRDVEGIGDEERIMEGLLALRNVPLFAHLSLHQLEAINRFVKDAEYLGGEVVVREGEPGDELFVLMDGEVAAFKKYGTPQQVLLSRLSPVSYFGEMAILDSAPRSATVVVTRDARLLRLGGERFKELILQTPEIAFEVFRVLTERIREAEKRLGS